MPNSRASSPMRGEDQAGNTNPSPRGGTPGGLVLVHRAKPACECGFYGDFFGGTVLGRITPCVLARGDGQAASGLVTPARRLLGLGHAKDRAPRASCTR